MIEVFPLHISPHSLLRLGHIQISVESQPCFSLIEKEVSNELALVSDKLAASPE
jgi:hypothetical protein